ncbi:DUF1360 domain-containing protein [Pseudomonas kurunegalensis]|uniref:DUF1360 domain-containing protein n=1 Tax=Pseudomonas kurunegalensis TaxID=485880 RepID=UPI002570FE5B|nr:DUF1360 domain-containing protein [Pseudomonas kurunegalensis]WJD65107.1 DUF1360 domain-containing protein [Pseudomonas kurunegalensis]
MSTFANDPTLGALWACFVIAVAASSIAYTITMTELFVPVRAWSQKLGHMIGYLFNCFYCMSHWIVFAGVLIYKPVLLNSGYLAVDLLVSMFFTITLSAFICGFIFKVFLVAMAMKIKEKEIKEIMSKK